MSGFDSHMDLKSEIKVTGELDLVKLSLDYLLIDSNSMSKLSSCSARVLPNNYYSSENMSSLASRKSFVYYSDDPWPSFMDGAMADPM